MLHLAEHLLTRRVERGAALKKWCTTKRFVFNLPVPTQTKVKPPEACAATNDNNNTSGGFTPEATGPDKNFRALSPAPPNLQKVPYSPFERDWVRPPGGRDLQVAVVLVNRAESSGAQWLVLFVFFFCAQRGALCLQTCRTRRSAVIAGLSGPRCLVGCHA